MRRHSAVWGVAVAVVAVVAGVALVGVAARTQDPPRPEFSPQPGVPGVVAAGSKIEAVKDGFQFLEGPNGTPDGGLYFSDLRTSTMYRLDPSGTIRVAREKTNSANGMALMPDGSILSAEHDLRRVSRWQPSGTVTDFATHDGRGQQLLRPNDIVVDTKRGGVYFTDPGVFQQNKGRAYVHYVRPDGTLVMISDELRTPNGLALTLDGKTLYVGDTEVPEVYAFDLRPDGSAVDTVPRVFARLRNIDPPRGLSYADGMCMDTAGRLYVTSTPGIQIFEKGGRYLGTIGIRRPSSCAFGGSDRRTLYITGGTTLYRIATLSQGPNRPGNK